MPLTNSAIKRALADNAVRRISQYYTGRKGYDRQVLDRIATDCLFTITLKTDERRARALKAQASAFGRIPEADYSPRPYTDVGFEFTEVNHLMNVLNAKVFGSRWREPSRRDQLPVAGFFIDADGSRYWMEAPPLKDIKGLHIHGFLAFPETHIERAQQVVPTLMKTISGKNRLMFDRYEIARFDPARVTTPLEGRSALENYVEYIAKGVAHLMMDRYRRGSDMWSGELYREYPNPAGGSYGYPVPSVGSGDRKVPFEAFTRTSIEARLARDSTKS